MSTQRKYDYTALSCLQRCETEFAYRHVRGLVKAGAVSASAHFGQMLHVGVRALYDGRSAAEAGVAVRRAWADSTAGLIVAQAMAGAGTWGCAMCGMNWDGPRAAHESVTQYSMHNGCQKRAGLEVSFILPILDAKKRHLSPGRAIALVEQYAEAYIGKQPYTCVWNEGYAESATESGLPDRAVRATDGKLYAMDLKTTGMYISSTWQRSFEHSQQVAMQLDILEATLGERLEGFVLDAVNIRQVGDGGTNLVRYGPLSYSDALRAELREQRQRLKVRADELVSAPETALKAPGACVRYNDLCPYFDLCQADPADREPLVQIALGRGQMEARAWNPKTRDE